MACKRIRKVEKKGSYLALFQMLGHRGRAWKCVLVYLEKSRFLPTPPHTHAHAHTHRQTDQDGAAQMDRQRRSGLAFRPLTDSRIHSAPLSTQLVLSGRWTEAVGDGDGVGVQSEEGQFLPSILVNQ